MISCGFVRAYLATYSHTTHTICCLPWHPHLEAKRDPPSQLSLIPPPTLSAVPSVGLFFICDEMCFLLFLLVHAAAKWQILSGNDSCQRSESTRRFALPRSRKTDRRTQSSSSLLLPAAGCAASRPSDPIMSHPHSLSDALSSSPPPSSSACATIPGPRILSICFTLYRFAVETAADQDCPRNWVVVAA